MQIHKIVCIKIQTDSNLVVKIFSCKGEEIQRSGARENMTQKNRKFSRNEPIYITNEQMFQGSVTYINAMALK